MHTATPWMFRAVPTSSGMCFKVGPEEIIYSDHGGVHLYDDHTSLNPHKAGEQKANAEFIVRAVNAHDDLAAALTDLYRFCCLSCADDVIAEHPSFVKARAALAKAEK